MMLKITKLERDSTQTKLNYEQLHQSIKFETLISKQNLIFISLVNMNELHVDGMDIKVNLYLVLNMNLIVDNNHDRQME